MKLNKDNYELVMFDLLEGNLSELDELIVMDQIEGDEFLFREWRLFKSTVLIADEEVTYRAKNSLLKDDKVIILPMYTKWTAVAASICILAVVVLLWPEAQSTKKVSTVDSAELLTPDNKVVNTTPIVEEVTSAVNIEEVDSCPSEHLSPRTLITLEASEVQSSTEESKVYAVSGGHNTPDEQNIAQEESHMNSDELPNEVKHGLQIEPKTEFIVSIPKNKEDQFNPKKEALKESSIIMSQDTEGATSREVLKTRRQKVIVFVTNNPLERIKKVTSVIYNRVRNPQVRITRNSRSKRPSLNIELETEGYHAIASIQPFKNKTK
jgi:hypothetical protein